MRINYEFITGEKLEFEVDEGIGEVIIEIEKSQSKKNRTETRRHYSLEFMQEKREGSVPKQFADEGLSIEQMMIDTEEKERLHQAIRKLNSRDALIVKNYYFEDKTLAEIGKELSLSTMAVSKRLKKIPDKIKKIWKKV